MCLAVPMMLETLTNKDAGMAALGGSRHEVDLSLIDNPQPGDYLIVHAGFAIEKLDTPISLNTPRTNPICCLRMSGAASRWALYSGSASCRNVGSGRSNATSKPSGR